MVAFIRPGTSIKRMSPRELTAEIMFRVRRAPVAPKSCQDDNLIAPSLIGKVNSGLVPLGQSFDGGIEPFRHPTTNQSRIAL